MRAGAVGGTVWMRVRPGLAAEKLGEVPYSRPRGQDTEIRADFVETVNNAEGRCVVCGP